MESAESHPALPRDLELWLWAEFTHARTTRHPLILLAAFVRHHVLVEGLPEAAVRAVYERTLTIPAWDEVMAEVRRM